MSYLGPEPAATTRADKDFYPTPESSFTPLVPYIVADCIINHDLRVWEPACGDGRLIRLMQEAGLGAEGNDLRDGYDFLEDREPRSCIVTNPPFSLAFEFAQHALKLSRRVYLLLRLDFLASQSRKSWWIEHEPNALFVLSKRPSFTGTKTDARDYGFFAWTNAHSGFHHI